MTKLYKAIDKYDSDPSVFMVNEKGVAVSRHCGNDELEIEMNKKIESYALYDKHEDFESRAINPVLIAEW